MNITPKRKEFTLEENIEIICARIEKGTVFASLVGNVDFNVSDSFL